MHTPMLKHINAHTVTRKVKATEEKFELMATLFAGVQSKELLKVANNCKEQNPSILQLEFTHYALCVWTFKEKL